MRTILIFAISLILSITGNSQTLYCKKFKTGTFYYPGMSEKISIRKDSIQESYNNGKLEMIWKVNWINDCKYEMICDKILANNFLIKKGDRIVATIINTDENCYTASLIFYTAENPEGEMLPGGSLCIKKY